jgi:predicted permease
VDFKQLFMQKDAYVSTALKLLVMPVLTMFTVAYLPIASTIKYTLFFLFSMPSATSGVMLAVQYKKDSDFASICVLLSTILCILTIPPLYLFMSQVLGVLTVIIMEYSLLNH